MHRLDRALVAVLLSCAAFQLQAQPVGPDTLPKRYPWDQRLPRCFMAPSGYTPMGCAEPVHWPSHGEARQRVDNLLTMQDYDLLQRAEQELGFSRERFSDGQYRFDAWLASLEPFFDAWGARGKAMAESWASAKGRDGYATLALALAAYGEGWSVRGGGTANTVTPEAWTIFHRKLEEADAILEGASPKLKAMGPWYVLKMRIAFQHPKLRESAPELVKKASAAWPEYLRMYTVPMTYVGPLWRGSFEQMDEVARLAMQRNGEKAAMYAFVYERHLRMTRGGSYTLRNMAADWDLMKRGFREVESGPNGPQWMAANFALLACQMRDREETRRLYRLADGNNPAAAAQGTDPCRVFAMSE